MENYTDFFNLIQTASGLEVDDLIEQIKSQQQYISTTIYLKRN